MSFDEDEYVIEREESSHIIDDNYMWNWTDDDAAMMSLSGCILQIFLPVFWLSVYLGNDFIIDNMGGQTGGALIGMLAASVIAFLGSVYVFGVRKHPLGWKSVGFRSSSIPSVFGGVILGSLFVPVSVTLTKIMNDLMNGPLEIEDVFMGEKFETFPVVEFVAVFVMVAILVPIAEEAFFRGMLFRWLRYRAGLLMGLLVSSIAFGALHFSAPSMISISLIGIFCALAYERTNSIWTSIAIHAGNNGVVVIAYYFVYSSRMIG